MPNWLSFRRVAGAGREPAPLPVQKTTPNTLERSLSPPMTPNVKFTCGAQTNAQSAVVWGASGATTSYITNSMHSSFSLSVSG